MHSAIKVALSNWTKVVPGGSIDSVKQYAFDPSTGYSLRLATASGATQPQYSVDGGVTFSYANGLSTNFASNTIAIGAENGTVMIAALGASGATLASSTDGGQNYTDLGVTYPIHLQPGSAFVGAHLLAALQVLDGVHVTVNAYSSMPSSGWTTSLIDSLSVTAELASSPLFVAKSGTTTVIARGGSGTGVAGEVWALSSGAFLKSPISITGKIKALASDGSGFALIDDANKIWRSARDGLTWGGPSSVALPFVGADASAMLVLPDGTVLVGSKLDDVHHLVDGLGAAMIVGDSFANWTMRRLPGDDTIGDLRFVNGRVFATLSNGYTYVSLDTGL